MERPTLYELAAALRVARLVDAPGNQVSDVQAAYRGALTQGQHADAALRVGERLLLHANLLSGLDGVLSPTLRLHMLTKLDDATALTALALIFDELPRADGERDKDATGLAGETKVLEQCRAELQKLGRPDLVEAVQQVSLISDSIGYDILAPTLGGVPRRLEVKTASGPRRDLFRFFISRNEYDVGRRMPSEWSLVACQLVDARVEVIGWTRSGSLHPYLPDDASGRWTEALIQFPQSALFPGIPPAV